MILLVKGSISYAVTAFGDSNLDAIPPSQTYGCELLAGGINGGTIPVMRFRAGVSNVDGMYQYPGLSFVNTDYTVFAVVKLEKHLSVILRCLCLVHRHCSIKICHLTFVTIQE